MSVGVIIGRFQVPDLHAGHRTLIETVQSLHQQVLILVGYTPAPLSVHDPLTVSVRMAMIQREYPAIAVRQLQDQPTDEEWSKQIDAILSRVEPYSDGFTLYGGRENHLSCYSGAHAVVTLPFQDASSGTELREQVVENDNGAFRAGMIYASKQKFPTSYQCVDIAVVKRHDGAEPEVLMGRKVNDAEHVLRFVGGFVDPADASLEAAAARELHEECGDIEVGSIYLYIGSARVPDWRYRSSEDQVCSALFVTAYIFGAPRPHDDIVWCGFVPLSEIASRIAPSHRGLLDLLMAHLLPGVSPHA